LRHKINELLLSASRKVYKELKALCVWNKGTGGMGSLYRSQHELILVFKNGKASHRNNIQLGQFGRYRTNVWDYPGLNSFARSTEEGNPLELHPTPTEIRSMSENDFECFASTGVNTLGTMCQSFPRVGSTLHETRQ
jgi:hypothetical protein